MVYQNSKTKIMSQSVLANNSNLLIIFHKNNIGYIVSKDYMKSAAQLSDKIWVFLRNWYSYYNWNIPRWIQHADWW